MDFGIHEIEITRQSSLICSYRSSTLSDAIMTCNIYVPPGDFGNVMNFRDSLTFQWLLWVWEFYQVGESRTLLSLIEIP